MTKRRKILFAITKGNWGGAQRYVFDLATGLPRDQFEVIVLCGEGDRLKQKLKAEGIRAIDLKSLHRNISLFNDLISFIFFYKILKKERPDIIHLNSSKIGGIGSFAGRLARTPKIIFTGHGWAWNEDRPFVSKILITFLHWLTIVFSHRVIAVSEKVAEQIRRLPLVTGSKITVIHNGIADTEYAERFAARATLGGPVSEKFWIGTISELHKNKGLDYLISAFANITKTHPDTALVIIGEGEEREKLTALIEKLCLQKKIFLIGFVDNARKFLKALDIFVLASRTEAFPYVILEAGLAQLPVIASNVGGIPEVIADSKNGFLVSPGDKPGLESRMSEFLSDNTKAALYGHNLRKTVEQNFSINSMVEKTIDVYN